MKIKKYLFPFVIIVLALGLVAYSKEGKAGIDEETTLGQEENVQVEIASTEEVQEEPVDRQVDENEVVAMVNDEELKGEKYNAVLKSIESQMQKKGHKPSETETAEQLKKRALETLVNQALILQQAKEAEIQVSEAEIEEGYALFAKQFKDEDAMQEELKNKNVDIKTVKEQIAESIMFQKYQNEVVPPKEVSEKEIQAYYDQLAAESKDNGEDLPPLAEVKEDIEKLIEQEKQHKQLSAHLEELKKEAKIEFNI